MFLYKERVYISWKCSYEIRPFISNDGTYHSFVVSWVSPIPHLNDISSLLFLSWFCLAEHLLSLCLSFLTIIIVQNEWMNDVQCENDLSPTKEREKKSVQQSTNPDHILNWNIYWMNRKREYTNMSCSHIDDNGETSFHAFFISTLITP